MILLSLSLEIFRKTYFLKEGLFENKGRRFFRIDCPAVNAAFPLGYTLAFERKVLVTKSAMTSICPIVP